MDYEASSWEFDFQRSQITVVERTRPPARGASNLMLVGCYFC
jgi:hypothetical protein